MYFNKIITFILLVTASTVYGKIDCKKHIIYCRIIELQPNIDKQYAMKLSNLISKYSKKYGPDPLRSVAIANQESGIKNIDRCKVKKSTKKRVCSDIGIFQIHIKTMQEYNLDINRLRNDLEYQTKAHFKILKDKIKSCRYLKENSWSCYHSKTKKKRLKYLKDVRRWYKK